MCCIIQGIDCLTLLIWKSWKWIVIYWMLLCPRYVIFRSSVTILSYICLKVKTYTCLFKYINSTYFLFSLVLSLEIHEICSFYLSLTKSIIFFPCLFRSDLLWAESPQLLMVYKYAYFCKYSVLPEESILSFFLIDIIIILILFIALMILFF